jgi:hypothetical protein
LIHRKSDIWSIASLSYYLHTCDLYVENNKNNIDEQYTNLINLDNKTKKIDLKFGNKEIISKTHIMINNNVDIRPITYFSKIYNYPKSIHVDNYTLDSTYYFYDLLCYSIIKDIKAISSKNFMINNLDQQTYDDLILTCYKIEIKIKNKIKIKIMFLRTIILWLVSHIFMSNVWLIENICLYMNKILKIYTNNDNVNKMSTEICNMIGWNFEF